MCREACSTTIEVCCKKGRRLDDEISRRRPDGSVRPSVRLFSPLDFVRAFLASIPRHLSPSYQAPIFRLDSADSPLLFLSLHRTNISPSAASSSDRIEESSETAAISAEIESQNGENDCEWFPPSPLPTPKGWLQGGAEAEGDGELPKSEKMRHQMGQRATEGDEERERKKEREIENYRDQVEMHSRAS